MNEEKNEVRPRDAFMPREKRYLKIGGIYHVVLRRIANLPLFNDEQDYFRAIFSLYEFNTTESVRIYLQREKRKELLKQKVVTPHFSPRDLLVEILAFCLMPNHIHLILRQLKENGITEFVRKFASGYPVYFKNKYQISLRGHFFQDRFLAREIENDDQLKAITIYVHPNPVELTEPKWKNFEVENPKRAIEFLNSYRWSSYLDYIGTKNFPSLTSRQFLLKIFGDEKLLQKETEKWILFKHEFAKILSSLSLE